MLHWPGRPDLQIVSRLASRGSSLALPQAIPSIGTGESFRLIEPFAD